MHIPISKEALHQDNINTGDYFGWPLSNIKHLLWYRFELVPLVEFIYIYISMTFPPKTSNMYSFLVLSILLKDLCKESNSLKL